MRFSSIFLHAHAHIQTQTAGFNSDRCDCHNGDDTNNSSNSHKLNLVIHDVSQYVLIVQYICHPGQPGSSLSLPLRASLPPSEGVCGSLPPYKGFSASLSGSLSLPLTISQTHSQGLSSSLRGSLSPSLRVSQPAFGGLLRSEPR